MASSSVSQESLDMDDFDTTARRNRIRVHRGHSGRGAVPFRSLPDRGATGGIPGEHEEGASSGSCVGRDLNGEGGDGSVGVGSLGASGLGLSGHGHHTADHESPTRSAAARLKDKQRGRPNHMKGKLPKDKRKLREKRRSTGVVHCMPSTESTGDSLDEDDDDEIVVHDTKKNTMFNEGTNSSHHHHQSFYEGRSTTTFSHQRRNKSPSDLEADLEDNQDYDSTVSHSETNLTMIGRSESSEMQTAYTPSRSMLHHQHQSSGVTSSKGIGSSCLPEKTPGGSSFSLKYSPETNRAMKFSATNSNTTNTSNNGSSDADSSSRTNTPSTSSSSSVLSRWRDYPDVNSSALPGSPRQGFGTSAPQPSPDSPRRFGPATQGAASSGTATSTTTTMGQELQAASTVSSSGSSGSITGTVHSRPLGFSVFRDGNATSSVGKSSYSNSSYLSTASRLRDREGGISSLHTRMANYQSPRPYGASTASLHSTQQQQNSEALLQMEKQLEKEREDNKRLQQQLEEKEKKIAELEKAIELLNSECDGLDEDNLKLQEENQALIRAMSKLTSNV